MLNSEESLIFYEGVADQVEAGVNLSDAISRMATTLSNHESTIVEIVAEMNNGKGFGKLLEKYDFLPSNVWSQITLGEQTGCIDAVLHKIAKHNDSYFKQQKKTKSALLMPAVIVFAAGLAFLGFMLFIFPLYAKSLSVSARESGVFYLSQLFVGVYESMPFIYLLPILAIGYAFYLASTNKQFSNLIFNYSLIFPFYGEGIKKMLYSGWCTNTAIAISAGMNVFEAISLSNKSLTKSLVIPFELMMKDVEKRGWSYSINSENWTIDDPRRDWPIHLITAIDVGGELNKLDVTLSKAAEKLMENSKRDVDRGIKLATAIATSIAIGCIMILAILLITAQTAVFTNAGG